MNTTDKVKEFHETFGHPVNRIQDVEDLKTRQLRIKLLFEELGELALASDVMNTMKKLCMEFTATHEQVTDGNAIDKVEELDALCDIQYVLDGKKLTSGLHEVFEEAFETVHKNNMTKAHTSPHHVAETVKALGGQTLTYQEKNGKYLAYNNSGKLVKPHDHTKVGLKSYLENRFNS